MRNPYKCIYSSSYDRGLLHLLDIWSDIKKQVPEAELHIFYGWNLFNAVYGEGGSGPNPERQAWRDKVQAKMDSLDGVFHHGRVGQKELIEQIKSSGLWTYPTDFYEINCISALQAQAYGAIPVVINYAALKETVQYGVKVEGDIYDPEVKNQYKEALVKALTDHTWQEQVREPMMKWAQENYMWERIAKQWHTDLFKPDTELKEAMDTILKHDVKLARYMPVQMQKKYGINESY